MTISFSPRTRRHGTRGKAALALAFLVCALASARAFDPSQSPFSDRACDSYSNYKDSNGKLVQPLWGSIKPEDFGSRAVQFDMSGVRKLTPVPAAGVHPRIFFGPDDLPELRQRLKETRCGKAAFNNILCWTRMMKGDYDDKADYAQPDVWKGSFGGLHGPVPLYRLGIQRVKDAAYNHNPNAAAAWRALVDGTATDYPEYYWNVIPLEAFRCLIKNDKTAALETAKAAITAMKLAQAKRNSEREAKHAATPPEEPLHGFHMGFQLAFTYDFLFGWLSPEQRKAMHDELAETTWSHDNYGTFNEATASRSNWATFSYWLFEVLGIEGEPGFNELKVRGMYRGWRNLFTYGWFQSGATYEGEAKNQLGMDGIIPFARRAKLYGFENLCGHPYLRAYATKFLPHSVLPTLDGFIKYDLLGGAHSRPMWQDLLGLKYMFPDDRIVDWVFRSAIGENYENVPDRPDGYRNDLLFAAIFAADYDPANNDPAAFKLGNTFFCGERALMMTRSEWGNKDAVMLNMHTRQANGGHPFADRNSIMLAGAGRVWSPPGYASFTTAENSEVCIDGKTQDEHTPGRMIDFVNGPLATFVVGDASYAWNWKWRQYDRPKGISTLSDVRENKIPFPAGWEPEKHTVNDFAFTKLPFGYLNVAMVESPSWILPAGALRPVLRQPNYPAQRAIRTAGLVRGQSPYVLVVDDIQKDASAHHYDWTLAVEPDIQIAKVENHGKDGVDICLSGNDPLQKQPASKTPLPPNAATAPETSQPMLLVRVLNCNSDKPVEPTIVELPNATDAKKYSSIRRLLIPSDSVSPDFKVLLFPFRQGQQQPPTTAWDAGHKVLTISSGNQKDTVRFETGTTGRTGMVMERGGEKILSLSSAFAGLPEPAAGAVQASSR